MMVSRQRTCGGEDWSEERYGQHGTPASSRARPSRVLWASRVVAYQDAFERIFRQDLSKRRRTFVATKHQHVSLFGNAHTDRMLQLVSSARPPACYHLSRIARKLSLHPPQSCVNNRSRPATRATMDRYAGHIFRKTHSFYGPFFAMSDLPIPATQLLCNL